MNTGLLLIDFQMDYFPGGKMELEGSIQASLCANKLLSFFRDKNLPVIHVQHFSTRPGATFFIPGTSGTDIHENVKPINNEPVLAKNYPNSFRNTGLEELLKGKNIDQLVIAGMMTHMCIDATTRAAFDLGYNCTIINDACATRALTFAGKTVKAEDVHNAFLAALNGVFAKVLSTEEYTLK